MASMVGGAMSSLLSKLGDLLTDEYKLQKSVRGEIMFLKAEFESMQAALLKVSEAPIDQPPDNQVKLWAREVRQLSYDVEDKVDTFMVRIDRGPMELHGLRGFIDRSMDLLTKAKIRHKLGTQIKDLRRSIMEVSERRDRYMVTQVAAKPMDVPVQNLRLSAMYKKAAELIGTEEKSNELINERLMKGDELSKKQLKTVSIVGFGGLGKTTLAKVVSDKLKGQFDCTAFVSVSENPNIERIFINMLRQLGHDKTVGTCDTQQLINEVRAFLQDKRYLIVIDDIWKTSVWKTIQYALIDNECGSIIISTTRNLDVANKIGGVYQLQPLSLADSRKLFNLRLFGTQDKCLPNKLAEVSTEILRKCGGVPLAIITISSTLAGKKGMENIHQYWSKVCKTLGSGLEDSPDVEDMRRILSISYYDLPLHLKDCMLYLSSYPEDYEISTKDLIWKWMGEGFILKGKSFYEAGEDYIVELINRSMIQSSGTYYRGSKIPTYFQIHDMVLDLITRMANEDGFMTTIHDQQRRCQQERIHRLSLQPSNEEYVEHLSAANLCHVRSLFADVCPEAYNWLPPLSTFPVLRVLCFNGCGRVDHRCFKEICNLIHLRYLGLRKAGITEIPKEIQKLQLLQVLDVSETGIHNLPSTFVLLRKLVCLRVDTLEKVPAGFGNLKLLQQLDFPVIYVESPSMLNNFSGLSALRHVRFRFNEWDEGYIKPFLQCLSSLVSLEFLQISGPQCDFSCSPCDRLIIPTGPQQLEEIDMLAITMHTVPKWMSALSALTHLCIHLLRQEEEGLHALGSIPSLSDLVIYFDREEKLVISSDYPFLSLTKFHIRNITRVVFVQGAMPKLQTLLLGFKCTAESMGHGDLAIGLENLSSLVEVHVSLYCLQARPEELKAAKATIQNGVSMNKNKPSLEILP